MLLRKDALKVNMESENLDSERKLTRDVHFSIIYNTK